MNNNLAETIRESTVVNVAGSTDINSVYAYRYIRSKGIKYSNLGFQYLLEAINIGVTNPEKLRRIKSLYEEIANRFDTNSMNVERNIRYSIAPLGEKNKEFIIKSVNELKYKRMY